MLLVTYWPIDATNRLSYPCLPKYNSSLHVWRLHDMPLQAVNCYFFVEAFIIISNVTNHCICSMYHVMTCSGTYVTFISTSCHPPSDTAGTSAHSQHLQCLSYLSFARNSNTVHWQTNVTDSHTRYSTLQQHSLRGTSNKFCIHTK